MLAPSLCNIESSAHRLFQFAADAWILTMRILVLDVDASNCVGVEVRPRYVNQEDLIWIWPPASTRHSGRGCARASNIRKLSKGGVVEKIDSAAFGRISVHTSRDLTLNIRLSPLIVSIHLSLKDFFRVRLHASESVEYEYTFRLCKYLVPYCRAASTKGAGILPPCTSFSAIPCLSSTSTALISNKPSCWQSISSGST